VIAKFSKGEQVNMGVLCKLCDYFQCQMSDLVEHVPEGGEQGE
jgi:DNA-binding Xre family transcriptional regulator